jgi:hypothetical protein
MHRKARSFGPVRLYIHLYTESSLQRFNKVSCRAAVTLRPVEIYDHDPTQFSSNHMLIVGDVGLT